MKEMFKLKYRKVVLDVVYFYQFIEEWDCFIFRNPMATKKEKLDKISVLKEHEPIMYEMFKEDILNDRI